MSMTVQSIVLRFQAWSEKVISASKYLLIPFYLGLVLALGAYLWCFLVSEYNLFNDLVKIDEERMELGLLKLMDAAMTANLVVMIIRGSYRSFVNKQFKDDQEHVDSSTLKVKMGTSIIVIAFIHFLQPFLQTNDMLVKLAIICVFFLGTLVLVYADDKHQSHHTPEPNQNPTH